MSTPSLLLSQDARPLAITPFYMDFIRAVTAHIKQKGTLTKKEQRQEAVETGEQQMLLEWENVLAVCSDKQKQQMERWMRLTTVNAVQPEQHRDTTTTKAKKIITYGAVYNEFIKVVSMSNAESKAKKQKDFLINGAVDILKALPNMPKTAKAIIIEEIDRKIVDASIHGMMEGTSFGRKLLEDAKKNG